MKVKPFEYSFSKEDVARFQSLSSEILLNKDFLTMGKHCEKFELAFSKHHNQKFGISCNSGTSALEMIFRSLNIQDKEVLVATNTFGASVVPIIRAGGIPVFVDCDDDLYLSYDDLKEKITPKTACVLVVHIGGYISTQIDLIKELCDSKNLLLVEDAAHAHGSQHNGKYAGEFGVAAAYSFFTTKVITSGEGGMITTNSEDIYKKSLMLRNHGQSSENYITAIGNNWRMHEFSAILGNIQLDKLTSFIQRRNEIAKIYDEYFLNSPNIEKIQKRIEGTKNYYKYILKLPSHFDSLKVKEEILQKFEVSLGGFVYEHPCHLQPAFLEYKNGALPESEKLCKSHICLPIYTEMSDEQAHYTGRSVLNYLES